jgi:hypothetical protein
MSAHSDLERRLRETLGTVLGADLVAHLKRGAVLHVNADLDLVECGLAVARDDVGKVGAWLVRGHLRKPTEDECRRWSADLERRWRAAVVQPYVLIQPLD